MADPQFVIYNDAGIEQVSFNGINLSLISKVIAPAVSSWTTISGPKTTGKSYSFTVTAVNPAVAVATAANGTSGAVYATQTKTGTNQWRIDLFAGASTCTASQDGVTTLTAQVVAYVFDQPPIPSGGVGIMLYDAAGNCIFNSQVRCMRIVGLLDDANAVHGYSTTYTPPSGRTYAALQRSSWGQLIVGSRNASTGDELANMYISGVSGGLNGAVMGMGYGYSCYVGNTVSIAHVANGAVGQQYSIFGCRVPNGQNYTYFGDQLVLDVTGY